MNPELAKEGVTMARDAEATGEPGHEQGPSRKPYESPSLQEWGSILELTKGPLSGTVDGDFSGSGGV